jgi:hypothetical protein
MVIDKFSYTPLESCSQLKNHKVTTQKGKKKKKSDDYLREQSHQILHHREMLSKPIQKD